jgi:hypothetical protein
MELYIYDREMTLLGVIDEISSMIWTRRYWAAGEFKLLVPFTDRHVALLAKYRLVMKRGDNEAAEIRYVNIRKNSQGLEEIEAQGKFVTNWLSDRIVRNQIITTDSTQNILCRIVGENATSPAKAARTIPRLMIAGSGVLGGGNTDYASEPFINALLACETAAKAAKLGFRICTDIPAKQHRFHVYEGNDLTAGNAAGNAPCIFSQEFDNIIEQEFTNSVESLKSTAYVGGEELGGVPRKVAEVGDAAAGLERQEVFINATDITQAYKDSAGNDAAMTDAQYMDMLAARGAQELEYCLETLAFSSKVNTHANLKYRGDYDLGDRVTCVNKRWGIQIDVRITEIAEIYERNGDEIEITFGESLPALIDKMRQIVK